MRKKFQRGLALVLCIIMAFSCAAVPAGAVAISPAIAAAVPALKEAVIGWLVGKVVDQSLQLLKDWVNGGTDTDGLISTIGYLRTAQKTLVSEDTLRELAYEWNATCSDAVGFTVDVVDHTLDTGEVYRVIAVRRGYVVTSTATQYCLADGIGRILYCDATTELSGRWVSAADTRGRHLLDYNTLFNLAQEVGGIVRLKDNFYEVYDNHTGKLYCNVAGRRFSSIYQSDKAAVNQDRETTVNNSTVIEGDTVTNITEDNSITNNNYDQSVNIDDMTQVLPGGTLNEIDQIVYDDNTKTYYVDSHDVTNNETNFYLYQYHINYTSVTYIGQTEEYSKQYELYYQLPDGRDSADLTVEDLEQLSTSFKDVVNYARSADDLSQRALYHFDGNTADSSYWSYCSSFDWAAGASLTYMDEGTFGGSLYLDESEHDFTLSLPNNSAFGDFTLQFRYYQSHTEAPQLDSYIIIGGVKVLQFDGAKYYTGTGTAIAATSVGAWNELCLIRQSGIIYYYINGVYYTSATVGISSSAIRFYFGSTQQTYKKLDELRFSRGAIYTVKSNYTPTSVPYDTNLSLVLPDGKVPLADEVPVLVPCTDSSLNRLLTTGLSDWTTSSVISKVGGDPDVYTQDDIWNSDYVITDIYGKNMFYRDPAFTTLTSGDGFVTMSTSGTTASEASASDPLANGLFHPVCMYTKIEALADGATSLGNVSNLFTPETPYTLSVVLDDCTYSSITFQVGYRLSGFDDDSVVFYVDVISRDISSVVDINLVTLAWYGGDDDSDVTTYCQYLQIVPKAGATANIVYIERVRDSVPKWSVTYEGAVYDPGQLTESPVLAVRSNTDITTYQIGGVRPSYPQKGQVYAMVENGYIVSLQQYTGYAWESVDGRIWTGSRWIPASSYNVITLQDMYDIVDATQDFEYIYTETGFWSWFQRAWKELISRLDKIIEGQSSSGSGSGSSSGSGSDKIKDTELLPDVPAVTDPRVILPEGYTQLDYIEATGTQYIDSLFIPNQDTRVVLNFMFLGGSGIYGSRDTTSSDNFNLRVTNGEWQPGYGDAIAGTTQSDTTSWHVVDQNKNKFIIDGVVTRAFTYEEFTSPYSIILGGILANRNGVMSVYYGKGLYGVCQIYDNDVLVRHLIPCVSPADVIGMYDLVNQCFYGNSGTGEFIAGDETEFVVVEPSYSLVDIVTIVIKDGVWPMITGAITTAFNGFVGFSQSFTHVTNFFDSYSPDNSAGVLGMYNYGGADIWD